MLYAPTFSANEARLSRFGLEKEAERINAKLAALTKQAAAGRARVAGNLSPTGLSIEPAGETSFDELCRIYADQAAALDDAGVDLFVIETMLSVTCLLYTSALAFARSGAVVLSLRSACSRLYAVYGYAGMLPAAKGKRAVLRSTA